MALLHTEGGNFQKLKDIEHNIEDLKLIHIYQKFKTRATRLSLPRSEGVLIL